MKKIILAFLLFSAESNAITSTHSSSSSSSSSSSHPTSSPTSTTAPSGPNSPSPARQKIIIPAADRSQTANSASGELFYYPGVVSAINGKWVGGDNFLNISKSMALQVNFIKTDNIEITFTEEKIKAIVAEIFVKGGLSINTSNMGLAKPPLPFFNLIILIFPTGTGLAAACQGRLFEEVNLSRVQFKDEVFQAITWEQTNLVYGPSGEFEKLLKTTVEGLTNTFVTRVEAHQSAAKSNQ